MKKILLLSALLFACAVTQPTLAGAEQQPEMIAEKMAVKLTRGIANTLTSFIEFPKQIILTGRDMGGAAIIVGPLKGVGMVLYRTLIGATETVFFMVPQPGYYDPLMDPAFVWDGWEPKRDTPRETSEEK